MSVYDEQVEGYMCKICGHTFNSTIPRSTHRFRASRGRTARDILGIR